MTETLRTRNVAIALAIGLLLTLATGFGGLAAAVCGVMAQPAFALGVSWLRRSRALSAPATVFKHEVPGLLGLWAGGSAMVALLVSWPLTALHDSGSLAAVLALSVAVSVALLALWRTWPLWHVVEREGGSLRAQSQALAGRGLDSWHGLGAAAILLLLCAAVVTPAWPGLVSESLRWPFAIATAVLAPLLHHLLQRMRAAPVAATEPAESATFDPFAEALAGPVPLEPLAQHELVPQMYDAARSGRVDRALQLLDAGADPQAQPPQESRDQRSLAVLAAVLPDLRLLRLLISRGDIFICLSTAGFCAAYHPGSSDPAGGATARAR